ncbi:DUF58 domain-containing protein [Acidobacteriota bacterium]
MLEPLPLSYSELEQFRIKAKEKKRPSLVGGHQMRRKGQSLEFRDYQVYVPGDDIRLVDWRASARHGRAGELLVRSFEAEEDLTLLISIDTRDSMSLPAVMPKRTIAFWLSEAMAVIALRSDDRVILHRLFGKPDGSYESIRGSRNTGRVRATLERFHSHSGDGNGINLAVVDRLLPPTAVWLIISDYYFSMNDQAERLAGRMVKAQDGLRWIISVDLNSWSYEKRVLGLGARKIKGPGLDVQDPRFEIDGNGIQEVETRIRDHKQTFFNLAKRSALDHLIWDWPAQKTPDPSEYFVTRFEDDTVLQRLFMKESP